MTLQDNLRMIADMLDDGECGYFTGGLSVTHELSGAISIQADLRLLTAGGMPEPTTFIVSHLRLDVDGPKLVTVPSSEWPDWSEPLRN